MCAIILYTKYFIISEEDVELGTIVLHRSTIQSLLRRHSSLRWRWPRLAPTRSQLNNRSLVIGRCGFQVAEYLHYPNFEVSKWCSKTMVEEKNSKPSNNSNLGTAWYFHTLESFGITSHRRLNPLEELQGNLPQGAIHTGTDAGAAGDEAAFHVHSLQRLRKRTAWPFIQVRSS